MIGAVDPRALPAGSFTATGGAGEADDPEGISAREIVDDGGGRCFQALACSPFSLLTVSQQCFFSQMRSTNQRFSCRPCTRIRMMLELVGLVHLKLAAIRSTSYFQRSIMTVDDR